MPESKLFREIDKLETEQRNPLSEHLDITDTMGILEIINYEDRLVPLAVEQTLPQIATAVDGIVNGFKQGGRLMYFGAGTSGRLGIVDASECPPTFGTKPDMVQGFIAGGRDAMFQAQEGAEDSPENGENAIIEHSIAPPDIVCGIAASGRTPYVRGAVNLAKKLGCFTIMISTVPKERVVSLGVNADVYICPVVGPEVITGSTRMKSGTAQKLVLNMLTTASMVRLGKTYGNVMVDLQLTNKKLKERARKIIMTIAGISYDEAKKCLEAAQGNVKTALVMSLGNVNYEKAKEMLASADGFIRKALCE
jgi:N-acetylmuramic acid 6-phosphate etherase